MKHYRSPNGISYVQWSEDDISYLKWAKEETHGSENHVLSCIRQLSADVPHLFGGYDAMDRLLSALELMEAKEFPDGKLAQFESTVPAGDGLLSEENLIFES